MHVINRLYQKEFDFNYRVELPVMQYMIATTPRSGSTYFAMELWRTGLMGAPMEYANAPYISILKKRLGRNLDILTYWQEIQRRRTSSNGIFGYKMFIGNFLQCKENHPVLLQRFTPDKVIFLTRRNTIAQAISLYRAAQSKAWFYGVENCSEPEYSFDGIKYSIDQIHEQNATWQYIFGLTGTQVMSVFYEDLLANPIQTIDDVGEYFGIRIDPAAALNIPSIKVQRTQRSEEWMRRFEGDRAEANWCGNEGKAGEYGEFMMRGV